MRIMSIPIILALLLCSVFPAQGIVFAENGDFDPDSITTEAYILIDADTGQVISEKNADKKSYPSSTTKIMTALLLLEAKENNLDDEVTAGPEVNPFNEHHTLMKLKQNETVTYKDILYGMMIPSGNDAANVVAADLTGDHKDYSEKFSEMMNNRAKELGMENTHFANAHGVHDQQHYTTVRDMSKLAVEAMKHETFREVVKTSEYSYKPTNASGEPRLMRNTNHLLDNEYNRENYPEMVYEYTIGIKTGLTVNIQDDDGNAIKTNGCLVAAAAKDGRTLIVVLMGDRSEKTDTESTAHMRFYEAKKLFEYGFAAQSKDITAQIQSVQLRKTLTGDQSEATLTPVIPNNKAEFFGADEELLAQVDDAANITCDIVLDEGIAPPYQVNQEVGSVTYKVGEQTIYSCRVAVADASILPATTGEPGSNSNAQANNGQGNSNTRVKNVSDNRNFMIALLSVALIMMMVIFVRIMTAPRRRRRRKQLRRRYY